MKRVLICFALLCTLGISLQAADAPRVSAFVQLRNSLPHVWVKEKVRVFYTTEGTHAVSTEDANGNSVPDQVEDVATQAWAAQQLWAGLGFSDPLQTDRYKGVAWIDVHLLNRETLKFNGVAYDEIQRFGRAKDPAGTMSLCFDVATSVKPHANLTPAHEMFHVIQNSMTYFKNRWFTEGTARWSERGLGKGGLGTKPVDATWPPDDASMEKVFEGAYDTVSTYWEPLLLRQDKQGVIPKEKLPPGLLGARYANGEAVLKDLELTGWQTMRDVLIALGKADDQVRKFDRWPEAEQKSKANDAIIHRVVLETIRQTNAVE